MVLLFLLRQSEVEEFNNILQSRNENLDLIFSLSLHFSAFFPMHKINPNNVLHFAQVFCEPHNREV